LAEDYAELRSMIGRHEQLVIAQSQQPSACNAVHNIHQRLARSLLRLRDAAGSDKLLVTQDMMSQMLGVQRTSITLSASKHGLDQLYAWPPEGGKTRLLSNIWFVSAITQ
jgi:hypothetical protein